MPDACGESLAFRTSRSFPHWTDIKIVHLSKQLHQILAHLQVRRAQWAWLWVRGHHLTPREIHPFSLSLKSWLHFDLLICRWWGTHAVEVRGLCGSQRSPSTMWVLGVKRRRFGIKCLNLGPAGQPSLYLFRSTPESSSPPVWQILSPEAFELSCSFDCRGVLHA